MVIWLLKDRVNTCCICTAVWGKGSKFPRKGCAAEVEVFITVVPSGCCCCCSCCRVVGWCCLAAWLRRGCCWTSRVVPWDCRLVLDRLLALEVRFCGCCCCGRKSVLVIDISADQNFGQNHEGDKLYLCRADDLNLVPFDP